VEAARRAGYPWTEQMSRKMSRNVEKRGVQAAGNGPSEDRKCWQGVELCIHGLRSWGCMLSRKVRATRSSSLCFAHLARITRCKSLQPLRYLCQFMYLTTVKCVLRNSFDLNYLRKMFGTWVQAARLPLEPGEAEKLAAFLFRSPVPVSFPLGATRRLLNFFGSASAPCFCSYPLQAQHLWQS